jgi:stearoyl-CoA desaturase (delta-9 desaturase)
VFVLVAPVLIPVDDQPAPHSEAATIPTPTWMKIAITIVIVGPFLAVLAAPFLVWGGGCGPVDIALLVAFYLITGFGITAGFHRLFVHRSFDAPEWVKFLFGVAGSMAWQGTLFHWCAMHRRHHQHSDKADDPHSPHGFGGGLKGLVKGLWHSHMGWFYTPDPADLNRYIKDLRSSKMLSFVSSTFLVWGILGFLIPGAIGGLVSQSWAGFWTGFIWGGLVRVFLVHHVTWSVNSACHLWGRTPFKSNDESRNNTVFGILALGEGWHNAHHAFPTSARHGLRWWEFDASWLLIKALAAVGLATNIKLPTAEQLAKNAA